MSDVLGLKYTTNLTTPIPKPDWRAKLDVAYRAQSPVEPANLEVTNRTLPVPPHPSLRRDNPSYWKRSVMTRLQ
ncbi:MAG: hypothetical protein ACRER2_07115 [Methylococcales bacterium]